MAGEHLPPAACWNPHMARWGCKGGLPGGGKHILKVGKEPDWQRGGTEDVSDNECATYKIKNRLAAEDSNNRRWILGGQSLHCGQGWVTHWKFLSKVVTGRNQRLLNCNRNSLLVWNNLQYSDHSTYIISLESHNFHWGIELSLPSVAEKTDGRSLNDLPKSIHLRQGAKARASSTTLPCHGKGMAF